MRSGRPGPVLIDLPFDVQMARSSSIRATPAAGEPGGPAARAQIEKAIAMLAAERPLIVAGGGIINADASELLVGSPSHRHAGHADLDGLGGDPRRPSAHGRDGRPADQPPLRQCDDARERLRAGHRQPLGQPPHRRYDVYTRAAPSCTWTSSRRRSAACSRPISASCRTRRLALELFVRVAEETKAQGPCCADRGMGRRVPRPQEDDAAQDELRGRADEAAARVPGHEQQLQPRHLLRQHHRALADRGGAVPARLQPTPLDQLRPGRTAGLGRSRPRSGPCGRPEPQDRRLSGDYSTSSS